MNVLELVELREMRKDEQNFILSSWLKSLRAHSAYYSQVPAKIYFAAHADSIQQTLDKAKVVVATPADDPDIIVGYLVYEDRSDKYIVLHYCYVKNNFRRMGLAKSMVASISDDRPIFVTHITNKIKLNDLKFNPYFFRQERL